MPMPLFIIIIHNVDRAVYFVCVSVAKGMIEINKFIFILPVSQFISALISILSLLFG